MKGSVSFILLLTLCLAQIKVSAQQDKLHEVGLSFISSSLPIIDYEKAESRLIRINYLNQLNYRMHFKDLSFRLHFGLEDFEAGIGSLPVSSRASQGVVALRTEAIQLDIGVEIPFNKESALSPYVFGDIHSRISRYSEVQGNKRVADENTIGGISAEGGQIGLMVGGGLRYRFNEYLSARLEGHTGLRYFSSDDGYTINDPDYQITVNYSENGFVPHIHPIGRLCIQFSF